MPTSTQEREGRAWRHGLALLLLFAPLVVLLSMRPFVEPEGYLDFADRRAFLGIPNFLDVASSFLFLAVGVAGLRAVLRARPPGSTAAWIVFGAGLALVGFGSAYFHWNPTRDSIVWDRLPMVLAFMGFFVAVLADYIHARLAALLVPAVVIGIASVLYGYRYEDLRFYGWIQSLPLLAILAVFLYPARYTSRGYLLAALGGYVLAKAAELFDHSLFAATSGIVSGHTLKHVFSALAVWAIVEMVRRRALMGQESLG